MKFHFLKLISGMVSTPESKRADACSIPKKDGLLEQICCLDPACISPFPNGDYHCHEITHPIKDTTNDCVKNENSQSGYIPPADWSYDETVCSM